MDIFEAITALLNYAEKTELIEESDRVYAANRIIDALGLTSFEEREMQKTPELSEILDSILGFAVENGLCEDSVVYRDLFDTKIMGLLVARPSEIIKEFYRRYDILPKNATDYYYALSKNSNYIREYRVRNDIKWVTETEYGDIDITINLSKPEKDPKAIAAALSMPQASYPKCQLCRENEGYSGRVNHPARQNHRMIPVKIGGEEWFLQYSPYVYYNEHCIVLNGRHTPMKIDENAFNKLFDFVGMFPHYFVGSNADLPIVGGSILTHEHFQGGNYEFAMAKAPVETEYAFDGFEDVHAGIVKWPMSVIRLSGESSKRVCSLGGKILAAWRKYTDESAYIFAETDGVPHNTITPIARKRNGLWELDLVLRNNITNEEFPDGVYHPHPEHHHIKKENIGLIEVMGLAVLPSRLKTELKLLKAALTDGRDISEDEILKKHTNWAKMLKSKYDINENNCEDILRREVGLTFASILEQCGVFKRNEDGKRAFLRFLDSI